MLLPLIVACSWPLRLECRTVSTAVVILGAATVADLARIGLCLALTATGRAWWVAHDVPVAVFVGALAAGAAAAWSRDARRGADAAFSSTPGRRAHADQYASGSAPLNASSIVCSDGGSRTNFAANCAASGYSVARMRSAAFSRS